MCEENEARREEEGASLKRRTSAEEHTTKAVDIIEGQWIVMVNTPVNSPPLPECVLRRRLLSLPTSIQDGHYCQVPSSTRLRSARGTLPLCIVTTLDNSGVYPVYFTCDSPPQSTCTAARVANSAQRKSDENSRRRSGLPRPVPGSFRLVLSPALAEFRAFPRSFQLRSTLVRW